MDMRLVAWGHQVKSRRRGRPGALPPLWLFTDPARMDVERAVAALPRGLCGVVFRHDGAANRPGLLRRVARRCRERRLLLVVAGGGAAPPGAGRHLRGGRGQRSNVLLTSSAHGMSELVRARRRGAALVFLSPVFPTPSHPEASPMGPLRFASLSARAGLASAALGGVSGGNIRRCRSQAAGAIGALLP